MKLSILQKNIDQALQIVSHIVSGNNPVEVLDNILLQTNEGRLEVQATNLEVAVSIRIGAKIEETGSITVPARLFFDLIHSLPNDKIQLSTEKENVHIKANQTQSLINGLSSADFPKIPQIKSLLHLKIPSQTIIEAFESVLPCVSLDESRPILAGVLLKVKDKKLTCAATDSYRLAEWQSNFDSPEDITVILPYRSVMELLRIVKITNPVDIEIDISETEAVFSFSDIQFITQLIEGQYPDYTKIIPESSTTTAQIDRQDIITHVKIAALFARSNAQTIQLEIQGNGVTIHSNAATIGTNSSTLESKNTGENITISLNAKYLLDVAQILGSSKIDCNFRTKLEPCLITPVKKSGAKLTYIIMPLKS